MNPMTFSRSLLSSGKGWTVIEKARPSLTKMFASIVVPLALLPPVLLYYAGSHYGDDFISGFGSRSWGMISAVFFIAELLTYAAMGWLIKQVADVHAIEIGEHDAYTLAAIAPVPLWLSAIGLLVPSLWFNVALSFAALAASCALIYQGVQALCHLRENVTALAITQTVMGAGLASWAALLVLIFILPW